MSRRRVCPAAQALLVQGETEEAERELVNTLELARETSNPPQLWKTHVAYGDLRRAQGKPEEARECYRDAYAVIKNVAAGIDDGMLLETFLSSSHVQSIRRAAST
ncbi:MAG: tetratricopeptide repeat protein [Dehalococcoidia bacterium]